MKRGAGRQFHKSNPNPRPSSIDTPLHGFVPFKHVDHTHQNAAISIAACKDRPTM
jgi:rhamnose utilization protein RhaD (predicted bifunctional aldolase and dehydrogenase)